MRRRWVCLRLIGHESSGNRGHCRDACAAECCGTLSGRSCGGGSGNEAIAEYPGTCYLRLGRGGEKRIHKDIENFKIGQAIRIHKGERIAVFSTGAILDEVVGAADILAKKGINPELWSFPTVKPIDRETILRCAKDFEIIAVVEEHNILGGFGSAVAEVLSELPAHARLLRIGLDDTYCSVVGSQKYLRMQFGLDANGIAKRISEAIG